LADGSWLITFRRQVGDKLKAPHIWSPLKV
jgi:hypothetical protein